MNPELLDRLSKPGLLLNAVPEVELAIRLHEFGLLPEDRRQQFIATVSEYALEGQDLYALQDPGIRGMFVDHEFEEFLELVRAELLPRLDDVRFDWVSNHDDYIEPLLDSFEALKKHFAGDENALTIIERESERATWRIGEQRSEDDRPSRKLVDVRSFAEIYTKRSIFDDVDA